MIDRARHVGQEKRLRIIAALHRNSNATAVARQLGDVSYVTVWTIAHAEGIELADGYAARTECKISPTTRARILRALKTGASAREIARAVGSVSHVTVWAVAKSEGIALHGRAGRKRRSSQTH